MQNPKDNNFNIPDSVLTLGLIPLVFYTGIKKEGFIKGIISSFSLFNFIFKTWLVNHSKWYENRVRKRFAKYNNNIEPFIDIIKNPNITTKELTAKYPELKDWAIKNFDRIRAGAVRELVKENNITNEDEILALRNSIKMEDYIAL